MLPRGQKPIRAPKLVPEMHFLAAAAQHPCPHLDHLGQSRLIQMPDMRFAVKKLPPCAI